MIAEVQLWERSTGGWSVGNRETLAGVCRQSRAFRATWPASSAYGAKKSQMLLRRMWWIDKCGNILPQTTNYDYVFRNR